MPPATYRVSPGHIRKGRHRRIVGGSRWNVTQWVAEFATELAAPVLVKSPFSSKSDQPPGQTFDCTTLRPPTVHLVLFTASLGAGRTLLA